MPRKSKSIPLGFPLRSYQGENRLRIALVGMPNSGSSTLFKAVASTQVQAGALAGTGLPYGECRIQVGANEADLIDLPAISTLHHLSADHRVSLKYLLWGNQRPPVSAHEGEEPPAPFSPPDVLIQVIDATALQSHLELTLELSRLGRPMVIALNMMDQARSKGLHINVGRLQQLLGIPVVPMTALMGHGIYQLFDTAVRAVRAQSCPLPQPMSPHISASLAPLNAALNQADIHRAFQVPHGFLLHQFAVADPYFVNELQQHFSGKLPELIQLRDQAESQLPRPLAEEIHADLHHRAAFIKETVMRLGAPHAGGGWRYWLDELFLHPRWGLAGSLLVFAAVLFVVFEVSAWLDSVSAAWLVTLIDDWRPVSLSGTIGRGVADGLIGLIGIVIPYMIPLVLLLVALEESGVMHRIAFVVDRWFHHLGLHGGVAVPFLLGLGCNVPALSATAQVTRGRERLIASVLVTFVPCSARSAVILAIAGKYLGGLGIFAIFTITLLVIAAMGKLLSRHFPGGGPGQVQQIPSYAWPQWRSMLMQTWLRTSDILTIVTPLLVGGSVVLALLSFIGADIVINTAFTPVTVWWLGLPLVMGVPILFGVLRKELSLLMIYQALGTFDVGSHLDWVQIVTFLIFLTFYVPCISTFAVMMKTIGRNQAFLSIAISISVALLVSGGIRLLLEAIRFVF